MATASQPFSFRSGLAGCPTVDELRSAVIGARQELNVVLVQGPDSAIRFPGVCPRCGQPAESRLRIERAQGLYFPSNEDTPNETVYEIDSFHVPFCEACVREHQQKLVKPDKWLPLRRILSDANGFAGLVGLGISGMFVWSAVEDLRLAPLLLGCLPLATGSWLILKTWRRSAHMIVPKPTDVDVTVDFTPYLNLEYEPGWRAFQFRSAAYADLFRQLNADRLWDLGGEGVQRAALQRSKDTVRSTSIAGAVVGAISILMLWRSC